ncbi:MAG: hypothetical protein PHU81_00980 [Acidobacteriota bacterium]|nr:hypothetical protein [Acidobacteriota bacterium]
MNKKAIVFLSIIGAILLLGSANLALAQATQDVTFSVNLAGLYSLTIDKTAITFTDVPPADMSNPGTLSISANENPVTVTAAAITLLEPLKLTVTVSDDFGDTVPASTVSWEVASGSGYVSGSLSKSTAVTVGSWSSAILHYHVGTLNFKFLRNYATQKPGNYSLTATYTLSEV